MTGMSPLWWRQWFSGAYDLETVVRERFLTGLHDLYREDPFPGLAEVIEAVQAKRVLHHRGPVVNGVLAKVGHDLRVPQMWGHDKWDALKSRILIR